jgi:hypothetical protein
MCFTIETTYAHRRGGQAMSDGSQGVVLRLTDEELRALDAVRTGVGVLAGREVDRESALNAALELALVRLTDDFELPTGDAEAVRAGLDSLRARWARGNACLT